MQPPSEVPLIANGHRFRRFQDRRARKNNKNVPKKGKVVQCSMRTVE